MKRRKEFGPSHYAKMLAGLRQAAEQVSREEFNKIVAPAPLQMRLAFMDDKRPELPKEKYDIATTAECAVDCRKLAAGKAPRPQPFLLGITRTTSAEVLAFEVIMAYISTRQNNFADA